MAAPVPLLEAGGPCRHCRAPIVRRRATDTSRAGRWVHTDAEPICRNRWGEWTATFADPMPPAVVPALEVRRNRARGRQPAVRHGRWAR